MPRLSWPSAPRRTRRSKTCAAESIPQGAPSPRSHRQGGRAARSERTKGHLDQLVAGGPVSETGRPEFLVGGRGRRGRLGLVPSPAPRPGLHASAGRRPRSPLPYQYVDNTGHRLSDGFLRGQGERHPRARSSRREYGITDRLSASFGIPYVFAKYTGALPPPSNLPVDACACWHSGVAALRVPPRAIALGTDSLGFTPHVRYVLPSHDYRLSGRGGPRTRTFRSPQLGASVGARLPGILAGKPRRRELLLRVRGGGGRRRHRPQQSSFRRRLRPPRRDASMPAWAPTTRRRLTAPCGSARSRARPFFPPGELHRPAAALCSARSHRASPSNTCRSAEGSRTTSRTGGRVRRDHELRVGKDAHDGEAYTVGATWYFDFSK